MIHNAAMKEISLQKAIELIQSSCAVIVNGDVVFGRINGDTFRRKSLTSE